MHKLDCQHGTVGCRDDDCNVDGEESPRTTARESHTDNKEELEGTHTLLLVDTTCNDSHVNVW